MIIYEHYPKAKPLVVTVTKVQYTNGKLYIDYMVPCFGSAAPADLCVIFAIDDTIVDIAHYRWQQMYCLGWPPIRRAVIPVNKTKFRLRIAWNTVCCPWVHKGSRWNNEWLGGEQGTPGRPGYRIYGCIGKVIFDRVIEVTPPPTQPKPIPHTISNLQYENGCICFVSNYDGKAKLIIDRITKVITVKKGVNKVSHPIYGEHVICVEPL